MSQFAASEVGDGLVLIAGHQRLRFEPAEDGRLRFFSDVLHGGRWRPVAQLPNTLVQGPSFDLAPERYEILRSASDGVLVRFAGDHPCAWTATLDAVPSTPWITFEVSINAPAEVILSRDPFPEPWCLLWLGVVDRLRWTQHDTWRQTLIAAPTRSSTGAPGNDLAAAYLYDVAHTAEICFYAETGAMAWMSDLNLARFRDLEIGYIREGDRYGIGMHAHRRSGDRFPAGRQQFRYRIAQRYRERAPTEREALRTLIEACGSIVGNGSTRPDRGGGWDRAGQATLKDLRSRRAVTSISGITGHPAYWPDGDRESAASLELMTQVDVLSPLCLLARVDPAAREHADRLALTLDAFWRPASGAFGNRLPAPAGEEVVDSWYFFENVLIKLAWIARARADRSLQNRVLQSLQRARELAHRCQYLFPLFYIADRNQPTGTGWNLAVNGLYAYACLLAEDATGDRAWRREAQQALRTMEHAPLALLFHEPQELAFGALAASMLAAGPRGAQWRSVARFLLDAQLKMGYWESGPIGSAEGYDIRGGFQACAGLLYPAFKENVESILPWTGVLSREGLDPLLLRFMDLQRSNNHAFLRPPPHIPLEDLSTLELGEPAGRLGREIYGAGEVFWMAICFDLVARADDPEICVVWLDALDSWERFPPATIRLAIFNPTAEIRRTTIAFTGGAAPVSVTLAGGAAQRLDVLSR